VPARSSIQNHFYFFVVKYKSDGNPARYIPK
jgi:hypothetical protein